MGLCRNILYHGCSTPPCIGKSKTAENIGEGGLPVEIFVQEQGKLVTVWLTREKLIQVILDAQLNDGGFGSWGTINSESCAQVIVALTALGIDPTADSRFVKNGLTVLDALAGFYVTGGGFYHTKGESKVNGMATEQGYYALAAYYRFVNAQTRLYDMSDVTIQTGGTATPATGDTGVLVWVIALPVAALAAAFVLKRKEREE